MFQHRPPIFYMGHQSQSWGYLAVSLPIFQRGYKDFFIVDLLACAPHGPDWLWWPILNFCDRLFKLGTALALYTVSSACPTVPYAPTGARCYPTWGSATGTTGSKTRDTARLNGPLRGNLLTTTSGYRGRRGMVFPDSHGASWHRSLLTAGSLTDSHRITAEVFQ